MVQFPWKRQKALATTTKNLTQLSYATSPMRSCIETTITRTTRLTHLILHSSHQPIRNKTKNTHHGLIATTVGLLKTVASRLLQGVAMATDINVVTIVRAQLYVTLRTPQRIAYPHPTDLGTGEEKRTGRIYPLPHHHIPEQLTLRQQVKLSTVTPMVHPVICLVMKPGPGENTISVTIPVNIPLTTGIAI